MSNDLYLESSPCAFRLFRFSAAHECSSLPCRKPQLRCPDHCTCTAYHLCYTKTDCFLCRVGANGDGRMHRLRNQSSSSQWWRNACDRTPCSRSRRSRGLGLNEQFICFYLNFSRTEVWVVWSRFSVLIVSQKEQAAQLTVDRAFWITAVVFQLRTHHAIGCLDLCKVMIVFVAIDPDTRNFSIRTLLLGSFVETTYVWYSVRHSSCFFSKIHTDWQIYHFYAILILFYVILCNFVLLLRMRTKYLPTLHNRRAVNIFY